MPLECLFPQCGVGPRLKIEMITSELRSNSPKEEPVNLISSKYLMKFLLKIKP